MDNGGNARWWEGAIGVGRGRARRAERWGGKMAEARWAGAFGVRLDAWGRRALVVATLRAVVRELGRACLEEETATRDVARRFGVHVID